MSENGFMTSDETETNRPSPEHQPDLVEHERERTENYRKLVRAFIDVAQSRPEEWNNADLIALDEGRWTMSCTSEELIEMLPAIEDPGVRGDLLHVVTDLMDAAFDIGRYARPAKNALLAGLRLEKSEAAKRAAANSVATRRGRSDKWKLWCLAQVEKHLATKPETPPERLATLIWEDEWPTFLGPKRKWRTILDAIRAFSKDGRLTKR